MRRAMRRKKPTHAHILTHTHTRAHTHINRRGRHRPFFGGLLVISGRADTHKGTNTHKGTTPQALSLSLSHRHTALKHTNRDTQTHTTNTGLSHNMNLHNACQVPVLKKPQPHTCYKNRIGTQIDRLPKNPSDTKIDRAQAHTHTHIHILAFAGSVRRCGRSPGALHPSLSLSLSPLPALSLYSSFPRSPLELGP